MNIFHWIYYIDITLIALFYLIGFLSIEKEFKDVDKNDDMDLEESDKIYKKWEESHPILNWFQSYYYRLGRICEYPEEIYDEIKYFIQRGKRGYSDRDLWGFPWYLAEMLPKALKQLKEIQHILPTWKQGEPEEVAQKRWYGIMDNMIYTFEIAHKILNDHYIYCPSGLYDIERYKEIRENMSELEFTTIMTKEECLKYENGWELFQEHFFSLWD